MSKILSEAFCRNISRFSTFFATISSGVTWYLVKKDHHRLTSFKRLLLCTISSSCVDFMSTFEAIYAATAWVASVSARIARYNKTISARLCASS